jgi:malonyl-CoA/methylmalonyl-CoA synthetase
MAGTQSSAHMNNENFLALVERRAPRDPATVLLEKEDGTTVSYGEMVAMSSRIAHALARAGAKPGDRIAAQVEKSAAALALYLACLRGGFVYLPLNTAYQPAEVAYFLGDADACRVRLPPGKPRGARRVRARCEGRHGAHARRRWPRNARGRRCDGIVRTPRRRSCAQRRPRRRSSTRPARRAARRARCSRTATSRRTGSRSSRPGDSRADDVLLHALPIFHVPRPLRRLNHVRAAGGRADDLPAASSTRRRAPRRTAARDGDDGRADLLSRGILARPALHARSRSRTCASSSCGSAPLLTEKCSDRFESNASASPILRALRHDRGRDDPHVESAARRSIVRARSAWRCPASTCASPTRTTVRCRTGEIGSIQVRGDGLFAGYWRMPDKTSEDFTADGFFRTGDLGVRSPDGYVSITGRAKDLIISAAATTSTRRRSSWSSTRCPASSNPRSSACRIADFGEAVAAAVVLSPGATFDEAAVIALLKTRLANYKVPKRVHVIDDLPRNAMGKVQKAVLRERFSR